MSTSLITPRAAAAAGLASTLILTIGTLKRAGLVPAVAPVQLIAPLGQVFAIFLLLGLFAAVRQNRTLRVVAIAAIASLALTVGAEFALNFVFPYLPAAQTATLLAGPLGRALLGASLLFLVAAIATAVTIGRHPGSPRIMLALYAAGAVVVGLRAVVPATVLPLGLGVMTVGVLGMSLWLLRRDSMSPAS